MSGPDGKKRNEIDLDGALIPNSLKDCPPELLVPWVRKMRLNSSNRPHYQMQRWDGRGWEPTPDDWAASTGDGRAARVFLRRACGQDGRFRLVRLYRGVRTTLEELTVGAAK